MSMCKALERTDGRLARRQTWNLRTFPPLLLRCAEPCQELPCERLRRTLYCRPSFRVSQGAVSVGLGTVSGLSSRCQHYNHGYSGACNSVLLVALLNYDINEGHWLCWLAVHVLGTGMPAGICSTCCYGCCSTCLPPTQGMICLPSHLAIRTYAVLLPAGLTLIAVRPR